MQRYPTVRVAVVQAAPVLFNREATTEKAIRLIEEIAQNGVKMALFPEAFIPVYPRGLSFGTVVGHYEPEGCDLWQLYYGNSVPIMLRL